MGRNATALMVGIQPAPGLRLTEDGWDLWDRGKFAGEHPEWGVENDAVGYVFEVDPERTVSLARLEGMYSTEILAARTLWEALRAWMGERGVELPAAEVLLTCVERG